MIHLTFNTRHARFSPRGEVSPAALAALRPALAPGEHAVPGFPGYRVRVTTEGTGLLATVFAADRPLVTFGVAPDPAAAEGLWPILEGHYLGLTELPGLRAADFAAPPPRPESPPWCAAVVILPTPEEAYWLGDYERCLAWAWLDRVAGL